MNRAMQIHREDNAPVALQNLDKGSEVSIGGKTVKLREDIPLKHKFCIQDLKVGSPVIMYGVQVGTAQTELPCGSLLTAKNVQHAAAPYQYRNASYQWTPPDISKFSHRTFDGFQGSDGRAGTANYWLFIPLVFCENRNMALLQTVLSEELGYSDSGKYKQYVRHMAEAYRLGKTEIPDLWPGKTPDKTNRLFENADGVKFLRHDGGCGGTRQDAAVLAKLLAAYADHPNVGGITALSLGCQNLQTEDFLQELKNRNKRFDKPLHIFEQQKTAGEEQLIAAALRQTFLGLVEINKRRRSPVPLEKLRIGVKCGGSDGFSGISANPAVGYAADLLAALGGRVFLAEFPELCGAEQNLIDRAVNQKSAEKFMRLMKSYEEQVVRSGSGFHMNPSPGNIRDGLITDAMKSAGACRKGGTSPVNGVYDYAEPVETEGLNLICTPGNDVESTTGMAAAGATVILFTTGLGTPTGNPICPTIKISSNTQLANRMKDIIDIDAGPVLNGESTLEQMGEKILDYTISVASGNEIPKAVLLNQDDFIPWKRGGSL